MKLNILDYSPIDEGSNERQALLNSVTLAQAAEKAGYHRFWLSEHHEVPSVAGSNPEMIMMRLASATESIRIGSGGVMIPHYSSYKIAENFNILENYFPGRIDLGIGRSPSYPNVRRALNERKTEKISYEQQIDDLYHYLVEPASEHRFSELRAMPKSETAPDIWLLGTSRNSAKMAGERGMNYAYAKFAAASRGGINAIKTYREHFQPSKNHKESKTMVSLFVVIGETTEKAKELAKTLNLWLLKIEEKGEKPKFLPSVETANNYELSEEEKEKWEKNKDRAIVGTPKEVHDQLIEFAEEFDADELTLMPHFAGFENRLNGLTALMDSFK